jgi:hypothetical protein
MGQRMTLPSLTEYYLIEAVDLDRTWETHKDKIIGRAHEGRHHVTAAGGDHREYGKDHLNAEVVARAPWENDTEAHESARSLMHTNTDSKYLYFDPDNKRELARDKKRIESGLNHRYTIYHDQHSVAVAIRRSVEGGLNGNDEVPHGFAKEHFMNMVKEAAPHPKYIPTSVKMYANGAIKRMEDIPTQAAEAFGKYHKLATHGRLNPNKYIVDSEHRGRMIADKTQPGNEGIHEYDKWKKKKNPEWLTPVQETNFKAFDSLNDVRLVTDHDDHKAFFAKERTGKSNHTIVHDDDDVTVYHPHDHEAAVSLAFCPHTGKKAAWCTSADSSSGASYFDDYSKNGALLIYHPKKPLHDGEMYQTHHASNQYMDEHDDDVDYHHHSTARRTNDLGITQKYENTDRRPSARFPGFNSKSALDYTYQHMYENPEKYNRDAPSQYSPMILGIAGVKAGNVLPNSFSNYLHSRHPQHQDSGHWRPITADEAKASREEAEAKGKQYFPANMTVKDHAAYDAAQAQWHKVHHHFMNHDPDDEPEEDDDEWR